jgi:hypothetical protein
VALQSLMVSRLPQRLQWIDLAGTSGFRKSPVLIVP